jgi:RNA 2',3'-cyclic 3'-phosphodiesterase
MRLFIAIELPEAVVGELKRLQAELDLFGLRPVKEFHLTLKFLGDVPDSKIDKIKEILSVIRFKPFEAELSEIGVFPEPDYIRVIWAGINSDAIFSLQKDIDIGLEKMGFGRDNKFKPHLTLERVNFIKDKNALAKRLKTLDVNKLRFKVTEFKLIQSTLTPKGPIYETQAVYRSQ